MPADNLPHAAQPENSPAIEGFEMIRLLGVGDKSSVWQARQISLGRTVVIKTLLKELPHDSEDVHQFKQEAQIAASLRHPGIVQVYDFGQAKATGRYYFVMEFITGYSVGDWIRRRGRLQESDALIIARSVAEALRYAWDQAKVIHCDIKPDNLMVDGDGTIKVTDLGLAQAVSNISAVPGASREIIIMGTPNYMSPEQARGEKALDCRTDIYALGASLYHVLTGILPFGDCEPLVAMERQIHETYECPQKINPDISPGTVRMLTKMLAKAPTGRYQNWIEIIQDIIALEKMAAAATKPPPPMRGFSFREGTALPVGMAIAPGRPSPEKAAADFKEMSDPSKKQITVRLKPITAPPAPPFPPAAIIRPKWKKRRASRLGDHLKVMVSLVLLAIIAWYFYQNIVNHRNIFEPINIAISQALGPFWHKVELKGNELLNIDRSTISKPEQPSAAETAARTRQSPAVMPPMGSPQAAPPPATTPSDAPKLSLPALDTAKAAERMQEKETAPVNNNFPPVQKSPEPAADSVVAKTDGPAVKSEPGKNIPASEGDEYQRILRQCQRKCPQAGEFIRVRLKSTQKDVEGVLDSVDSGKVVIRVKEGIMAYPFELITDESRLQFFPEARARQLYQLHRAP